MALMSDAEFRFQPPRRAEMWRELALTMSQAAALTGVSERQIQHWMDRGYISPSSEGTRKINGDSLDEVVLIRQARLAGIPLRQAVRLAREYLRTTPPDDLDRRLPPVFLREVDQQLVALKTGIEHMQELLHDAGSTPAPRRVLPARRSNRV
jgi:DNA-binding transcriptional MerR regulator